MMRSSTSPSAIRSAGIAALASFGVAAMGSVTWVPLLLLNARFAPAVPWSAPAEGLALALIWAWLGGRGWPSRTAAARRDLLRGRRVPAAAFGWAAVTGAL